MYKLFLILRYLRKRRIALAAVVSVWLCVAMVLIVISVMGGFLDMVKERSRGLLGDLVVDNATLLGFPYYEEFIQTLHKQMPGQIAMATPVIYNYGILRVKETYTKPVRVVAIKLDEYKQVNDFANSLFYDKYYPGTTTLAPQLQPQLGLTPEGTITLPPDQQAALDAWRSSHPNWKDLEPSTSRPGASFSGPGIFEFSLDQPGYAGEPEDARPGLIIGCDLINERAPDGSYDRVYPRGSEVIVTLLPMSRSGGLRVDNAITKQFRYADDSRTRVYEIDNICVYADFELIQELLRMDPQQREDGSLTSARTSQVLIKLAPGVDAVTARAQVQKLWKEFMAGLPVDPLSTDARLLGYVEVETWQERQVQFIAAVEKEKVLVTILFALISVVAVVLIGCIFYMIVEKKTRDIGIIKSVGGTRSGVAGIFIGYGAAVGILGSILGTITGAIFVRYINEIQDVLARLNPQLLVWSPEVYTFDRIPNVVKFDEAAMIVLVAIVSSILGALVPAILAARIWPVDALRYE